MGSFIIFSVQIISNLDSKLLRSQSWILLDLTVEKKKIHRWSSRQDYGIRTNSYVPMKRGRKRHDPFNGGRKVKKLLASPLEVFLAMQFCSFYYFLTFLLVKEKK